MNQHFAILLVFLAVANAEIGKVDTNSSINILKLGSKNSQMFNVWNTKDTKKALLVLGDMDHLLTLLVTEDGGKTHDVTQFERVYLHGVYRENTGPIYLLCSAMDSGKSFSVISQDDGRSWTWNELPGEFKLNLGSYRNPEVQDSIKIHPVENKMLLAIDSKNTLFLSLDSGAQWQSVANNVKRFFWNLQLGTEIFYFLTRDGNFSQYSISDGKTNLISGEIKEILNPCAKRSSNVLDEDVNPIRVKLIYLIADVGEQDFAKSCKVFDVTSSSLESVAMEDEYEERRRDRKIEAWQIDEERIFLLVTSKVAEEAGESGAVLLVSARDAGQVSFRLSLRNMASVSDLRSVNGAYIVQNDLPEIDGTLISHDVGKSWHNLSLPGDAKLKLDGLALRANNGVGKMGSHVEHIVDDFHQFSVQSAPKLILAPGRVLQSSMPEQRDMYISVDGGRAWKKVLDGQHVCRILAKGGLLVCAETHESLGPEVQPILRFSLDQGNTWKPIPLNETLVQTVSSKTPVPSGPQKATKISFKVPAENASPVQFGTKMVRGSRIYFLNEIPLRGLFSSSTGEGFSVTLFGYHKADKSWLIFNIDFEQLF